MSFNNMALLLFSLNSPSASFFLYLLVLHHKSQMFFDFLYPYQFSSYGYQLLAPFTANKTAGDICGIDIIVLFPDTKAYFIKVGLFFWHNLQILNYCYYDPGEEKEGTHDGPCWCIWKGSLIHSYPGPGIVLPWSLWIVYGYSLDISQDVLWFCDFELVGDRKDSLSKHQVVNFGTVGRVN